MKRRVWKGVLGIVGVLVLAFGGLLWSAHRRADEVFKRHDAIVKEAIAAIRARPGQVPRLVDPELPGNGKTALFVALIEVAGIPEIDADEIPVLNGLADFKPDPEKLEAVFRGCAPVLEALRESARYRDFNPEYQYEQGSSMGLLDFNTMLRAEKFLSGRAAHAHQQGRDAEALESILLGLALAHQAGRDGPLVTFFLQAVLESIIREALREILPHHAFAAAELEAFAVRLDRYEKVSAGPAETMAVEDVVIRRTLVEWGMNGTVDESLEAFRIDRSWRYLFSRRLAYAGALGEFERYFQEFGRAALLPPSRRLDAVAELSKQAAESKNPVVRRNIASFRNHVRRDLEMRLEAVLMRVAVAVAWYQAEKGESPGRLSDLVPRYLPEVPTCPLTSTPLRYLDGKVWSVGRNGVDDGGTPGTHDDVMSDDGDVVWTVMRK